MNSSLPRILASNDSSFNFFCRLPSKYRDTILINTSNAWYEEKLLFKCCNVNMKWVWCPCIRPDVATEIGKSLSAVERATAKLVKNGLSKHVGSQKGGHWERL